MKDQLEDYIRDNREAFDDAVPSLKVWAAIDKELSAQSTTVTQKGQRISLWRVMTMAASVVLLLGVGAIIGRQLSIGNSAHNNLALDNEIFREVEDMKTYYETDIKSKEAQLVKYNERKNIAPDLEQIDQQLQELSEELKSVPAGSEEQVINAMINSYQAKAAILEKVLENLENKKSQTNKNNSDETNI